MQAKEDKKNQYDVIIIGTGAGGGTLLSRLVPSGKKILVIERGGYLPREKENWSALSVFVENRYGTEETWRGADGRDFRPGNHYFVGGNTKVYGAALFRFRERDFQEVRHQGGVSPAWPLLYRDFSSYYDEAEALYHVHGLRGSDPTEPFSTTPYPHAPVSHEPEIQFLNDSLKAEGLHPFPLPMAVLLNESDRARSACIRCNTCDGFPCLVNGKADAQVICVDPALRHANVTLLTHAYAEKLETSPSGREIARVIVARNGIQESYSASIVIVACGAVNSAALLLRSACDSHPAGLANRSGVVGRHYMCHNNSALLAISPHLNQTVFQKTLGLNDFYFESEGCSFPLGHVQMLGKSSGNVLREHAPAIAPGMALDWAANHALDFWLCSEDLPDPENRVTLRPDGGISLRYVTNNLEAHHQLVARFKQVLKDLGAQGRGFPKSLTVSERIPIEGNGHQSGTIRFGRDPTTSALDVNCKAHDVDNLYVVDSSFFPSISAINPALTIMANALRVGDHLLERLNTKSQ